MGFKGIGVIIGAESGEISSDAASDAGAAAGDDGHAISEQD